MGREKVIPIGIHKMHQRPSPGQRIWVLMKNGLRLECAATMVVIGDRSGIIIYHKRLAIDEDSAEGWWPMRPVTKASHDIQKLVEKL